MEKEQGEPYVCPRSLLWVSRQGGGAKVEHSLSWKDGALHRGRIRYQRRDHCMEREPGDLQKVRKLPRDEQRDTRKNKRTKQTRNRREIHRPDKGRLWKTTVNIILSGEKLDAFLLRAKRKQSGLITHSPHFTGGSG